MEQRSVVTVFLRHRDEVLLLRRSDDVGSYAGQWGAVAGHAEGDPDRAARTELREETGIDPDGTTLVRVGDPFDVVDEKRGTHWRVHPYLFESPTRAVATNWETSEFEWVSPTEILRRETVPDLWASYDRVRPTAETIAADTEHGSTTISYRALAVLRDEAGLRAETDAGDDFEAIAAVARNLRDARPSMTVLANRVNRAVATADDRTPHAVEAAAADQLAHARHADRDAAHTAAELIDGTAVATLSRSGTVRQVLTEATPESLLVAESRPGREGLGVAETFADQTTVTLTTDAAFGYELATESVSTLLVGADSILPDGSVVNKVGTRAAATVATREDIDVYAVAATDKIDPEGTVDLEPRDPAEVYDGNMPISVVNPTFDVTDAAAIDGIVTERGVLDGREVPAIAEELAAFASWG
ncbi:NUDIX domain-containing protein [Halovenus marina]|uniref:NUDIX domain-containing protein n=1 Tax=Halovenus marina TaxID=3396621 RepID=UPI003F5616C6